MDIADLRRLLERATDIQSEYRACTDAVKKQQLAVEYRNIDREISRLNNEGIDALSDSPPILTDWKNRNEFRRVSAAASIPSWSLNGKEPSAAKTQFSIVMQQHGWRVTVFVLALVALISYQMVSIAPDNDFRMTIQVFWLGIWAVLAFTTPRDVAPAAILCAVIASAIIAIILFIIPPHLREEPRDPVQEFHEHIRSFDRDHDGYANPQEYENLRRYVDGY